MIRAFVLLLALIPAIAGAEEEDPDAGWDRHGYERVKNDIVLRPLTTPRRTFDVFVVGDVFTPSATEQFYLRFPLEKRKLDSRLGLTLGAKLGLSDDFEVGVTLPPMEFRNGVEFTGPRAEFTWLAIDEGAFQLGLSGASVLPVTDVFDFEALVPMQLRLNDAMLLRFTPQISAVLGNAIVYAAASLPLALTVQLAPSFFTRLNAGVTSLGFQTVAIPVGVDLGLTIRGDYGAWADIALGFSFPTLLDGSGQGTTVNTEHWLVALTGRFYVPLPQYRGEGKL